MIQTFSFIFGAIIGSFLNVVIYRLPKGIKFSSFKDRSFCPHCQKQLKSWHLIPLLSYIILKGKCTYCHKHISLQYPLVELLSGLWGLIFISQLYNKPIDFIMLAIGFILIAVFFIDLNTHYIFDSTVMMLLACAFIYRLAETNLIILGRDMLISGSIFFIIYLLGKLIYRQEVLGVGDIKIAAFAGVFLGLPMALFSFYAAILLGAIFGLTLVIFKKQKLKSYIPFAPFMILGMIIAFFWGEKILNWYSGLI